MPDANGIVETREPYVKASLIVPKEFVGTVMELAQDRRGEFDHMEYLSQTRVQIIYELPLAEIVLDFYDQLKSRTRGYASFDYELSGFRVSNLVKLDILLNGDPVDALSLIVHRDRAYAAGKGLVERLRRVIPRQFFDVPIQASIGSRIIARETVKAKRKDVLAKCYGGDVTRKRKLLEKQKKGKKRMKIIGTVEVPRRRSWRCSRSTRARPTSVTRVAVIGHVEWVQHARLRRAARARRHPAAVRHVRGARGRRRRGGAGAAGARRRDALHHGAR